MPKAMERALRRKAKTLRRQGKLRGGSMKEAEDAFVYGTMRKHGWRPRKRKK